MPTPLQAIQQALDQARLGRLRPAIAALERLTRKKGAPPEAYHFLGMLLAQDGRIGPAVSQLELACSMAPGRAQFESNLGAVLAGAGRHEEALPRFDAALRADAAYAQARVGLAGALLGLGRIGDAEHQAREGWRLAPTGTEAAANLGSVLILSGRAREAVEHLRAAVGSLGPSVALNTLLVAAMNYDDRSTDGEVRDAHLALGALHAAAARRFADRLPPLAAAGPDALRLGFLSADFREHPVACFIEPALTGDDRTEVFCYDCTTKPDGVSARLRRSGATWRDGAGLGDADLAAQVRRDRIDVLVELSGHSLGHRQTALAARMARVQVSYLGYPATTGNPAIDARFVDSLSDPPTADPGCTERLIRLDPCAWCFTAPDQAPPVAPPPAGADGVISFGSFNNLSKTTPAVLDLWAALLAGAPGTRLVLKNTAFVDAPTRARVAEALAGRGLPAGRVDLLAPAEDAAGHLAAYAGIDIALDTLPYAGTTTTCEALWMGVPVVTLAGGRHAGRVGVSLLAAVGLEDLVADSPARYVDLATELAADRPKLAALRRSMRDRVRASPLMDRRRFRERLYAACRALADERSGGRA